MSTVVKSESRPMSGDERQARGGEVGLDERGERCMVSGAVVGADLREKQDWTARPEGHGSWWVVVRARRTLRLRLARLCLQQLAQTARSPRPNNMQLHATSRFL